MSEESDPQLDISGTTILAITRSVMKRSQQPIHLALVPSRYLAVYIILLHGSVLLVLPFISVQSAMVWILAAIVLLSFVFNWHTHLNFKRDRAIQKLERVPDATWILTDRLKTRYQAKLLSGSYVSPWLLVLRFRLSRLGRRTIILLPDR